MHLENIWEAFGRHLGSIWQTLGKHMGSIWEASGRCGCDPGAPLVMNLSSIQCCHGGVLLGQLWQVWVCPWSTHGHESVQHTTLPWGCAPGAAVGGSRSYGLVVKVYTLGPCCRKFYLDFADKGVGFRASVGAPNA